MPSLKGGSLIKVCIFENKPTKTNCLKQNEGIEDKWKRWIYEEI